MGQWLYVPSEGRSNGWVSCLRTQVSRLGKYRYGSFTMADWDEDIVHKRWTSSVCCLIQGKTSRIQTDFCTLCFPSSLQSIREHCEPIQRQQEMMPLVKTELPQSLASHEPYTTQDDSPHFTLQQQEEEDANEDFSFTALSGEENVAIPTGLVKVSSTHHKINRETRNFQVHWLQEFKWLRFDSTRHVMYCVFCQLSGGSMFTRSQFGEGTTRFKKETISLHGLSKKHLLARRLVLGDGQDKEVPVSPAATSKKQRCLHSKSNPFIHWRSAQCVSQLWIPHPYLLGFRPHACYVISGTWTGPLLRPEGALIGQVVLSVGCLTSTMTDNERPPFEF